MILPLNIGLPIICAGADVDLDTVGIMVFCTVFIGVATNSDIVGVLPTLPVK